MGLLDKLLHRSEPSDQLENPSESEIDSSTCPHLALVARWDSVADMGHEERATEYYCETCKRTFTPHEGWALRANEGERIREVAPPQNLN